jgi:hypothetical protein
MKCDLINDSILRHKRRPIWPPLNLYQNIKIYNSVNGSIPLISSIDPVLTSSSFKSIKPLWFVAILDCFEMFSNLPKLFPVRPQE